MGLEFREPILKRWFKIIFIVNILISIILAIILIRYHSTTKIEPKPHETNVILYDRTNKAIVQYEAFFEYKDDTVMLYDADVIQEEHDDEWDDIIN